MVQTLASPHLQVGEIFGWSVAVSDDVAVVGTNAAQGGANNPGLAYMFNVKTGALIKVFTSPHPQHGGLFGFSVAVSGHVIVIGAPGESSAGFSGAGNAYLFDATTAGFIAPLASTAPVSGGRFGHSVAISNNAVVVGAPAEAAHAGATYVFGASHSVRTTLVSPAPQPAGAFGISVGASGDTAQGPPRVVVGADGENSKTGKAYLFDAVNGNLIKPLPSVSPQPGGDCGNTVATTGDITAVGAPNETAGGLSAAGNAYIFDGRTGNFLNTLASPQQQRDGRFGWSVAVTPVDPVTTKGDLALVGAPGESSGAMSGAGAAHVFDARNGNLLGTSHSPNAQANGRFGYSVSIIAKSPTGTGFIALVGAPYETITGSPANASGRAYIL